MQVPWVNLWGAVVIAVVAYVALQLNDGDTALDIALAHYSNGASQPQASAPNQRPMTHATTAPTAQLVQASSFNPQKGAVGGAPPFAPGLLSTPPPSMGGAQAPLPSIYNV